MPSFSVTFSTTTPGVAGSIKNALIPFEPGPPVRNIAITTPAKLPLVHHCLRPSSTYSVAVAPRSAAQRRRVRSSVRFGEREAGDAVAGREPAQPQRPLFGVAAQRAIAAQIIECTESVTAVPASTFAISSIASA
jgi:hypothetical protein